MVHWRQKSWIFLSWYSVVLPTLTIISLTGKDWGQEEKEATGAEMVEWHHWRNGHEFQQAQGDSEGLRNLACCSPWGRKESNTTEWLNYKVFVVWVWKWWGMLSSGCSFQSFIPSLCLSIPFSLPRWTHPHPTNDSSFSVPGLAFHLSSRSVYSAAH